MSHNLEDDVGERIRRKVEEMIGGDQNVRSPSDLPDIEGGVVADVYQGSVVDDDMMASLKLWANIFRDLPPQPRIVCSEKCPPEHASYVWMTNGAQCFYFSPDVLERIAESQVPSTPEPLAAGQLAPMWGVPIEYDYKEVDDGSD